MYIGSLHRLKEKSSRDIRDTEIEIGKQYVPLIFLPSGRLKYAFP